MFLFLLQNNNLLLGGIPETVGLLLFGVGLIAITILLRWFFSENDKDEVADENLEKLSGKVNQ